MVVENTRDLAAYEKTGKYDGVYHVLHGAISPMLGIGPGDIRLKELMTRLQGDVEEIFNEASADLGNMNGRQRQFSLGFIGLVILYLVMKHETEGEKGIEISREEIEALVHQFMHGIYS